MDLSKVLANYNQQNVYIITCPVEDWINSLNKSYFGFSNTYLNIAKTIQKGDILLFSSTNIDYKKINKRYFRFIGDSPKIIGFGIFNRIEYENTQFYLKKIGIKYNFYPNRIIFSTSFWFGNVDAIDKLLTSQKSDEQLKRDRYAITRNSISSDDINELNLRIPASRTIVKLGSTKKSKILPILSNRLSIPEQMKARSLVLGNYSKGSIQKSLDTLQATITEPVHVNVAKSVSAEFVTDFRLQPFISAESRITTLKTKPKIVDFEARHREYAKTGSLGEELVIKSERDYLTRLGRTDLASKVKRVSLEDMSLGYDILSYDREGHEKYIEVKSTTVPKNKYFQFNISANEKRIAESQENYYVYLVFDVWSEQPKIAALKNPFKMQSFFQIEPTQFIVKGRSN